MRTASDMVAASNVERTPMIVRLLAVLVYALGAGIYLLGVCIFVVRARQAQAQEASDGRD